MEIWGTNDKCKTKRLMLLWHAVTAVIVAIPVLTERGLIPYEFLAVSVLAIALLGYISHLIYTTG